MKIKHLVAGLMLFGMAFSSSAQDPSQMPPIPTDPAVKTGMSRSTDIWKARL